MQIERLIQMVFHIATCGHVTARELAIQFGVSTRTIYRDMNTLTLAGIPIISTKGTGGGISLMEGYTLDRSMLSKEEQQHIFQGLQLLQATKYPNAEIVLSKIQAIFRHALEPKWLEIDLTYWGSDDQEKDKMLDIQYAIINKQPLSIVYFNTALQQTERVIEPLRLIFKSHAWYVIGFCRCKQEVRYFRLSRMRRQQLLPEFFERTLPENYVQMTAAKGPTPNLFVLKIRARPEIAYRLYDDFHESQVSLCEDGTYLVTAHFELNEWTCNYLLSFGPYIEVLAPEAVRTMVRERAREIAEHHR